MNIVVKKEGGFQESKTVRKFFATQYKCNIGMYSYGGCFDPKFNLGGEVNIGKYCSFATKIRYFGANHPTEEAVLSPYFYNKSFGLMVTDVIRHKIDFGNDVWVGYGAIFTSSCHNVGNGAVIASGAIVTKDVEAYAIMAGVPAKKIGTRFDEETINLLEKSQWWELSPNELFDYYELRKNPKEFALAILKNTGDNCE